MPRGSREAPVTYDRQAIRAMAVSRCWKSSELEKRRPEKERRSKVRHDAAAIASIALVLARRGHARRKALLKQASKRTPQPKTRVREHPKAPVRQQPQT